MTVETGRREDDSPTRGAVLNTYNTSRGISRARTSKAGCGILKIYYRSQTKSWIWVQEIRFKLFSFCGLIPPEALGISLLLFPVFRVGTTKKKDQVLVIVLH